MATVKEKLQQIERTFPVDDLLVNEQPFWPFFKLQLYSKLLEGLLLAYPRNLRAILQKGFNCFFQFPNWFRNYDYIVFSNELERKSTAEGMIDKLTEGLIRQLGYEKVLYVEQVSKKHLPIREYGKKRIVSMDLLVLAAGLYQKVKKPGMRAKVEGEKMWSEITRQLHLQELPFRDALNTFLSKVAVFSFIFRRKKPKAIFITDYGYSSQIFAAKKLGITIVEFQHGVIGFGHPYYHSAVRQAELFCPDFVCVFGKNDIEGLAHGNYVPVDRILPVGNYYLNLISQQPVNEKLTRMIDTYRLKIGVPTDFTTHQYLTSFIQKAAAALPDCLFLICPRNPAEVTSRSLSENVRIMSGYSYQEVIRHCDINTCTNSTCALEALTLGAMNILIDEDGKASDFFGSILTDEKTSIFVKSPVEYINVVKSLTLPNKHEVMQSNVGNFMTEYDRNLSNAIATIQDHIKKQL